MSEYVLPYSAYQVETALKNALEPDETLNKKGVPADALAVRKYIDNNAMGGAQADWNAAEGEPGYIQNKPFGDKEVEILPETELTFVTNPDMGGMCLAMITPAEIPIEGSMCTVVFDGVTYNNTVNYIAEEGIYCFGNLSMMGGEDSGEPYIVMFIVDSANVVQTAMILSLVGEITTTVVIKGILPVSIATEYAPKPVYIDLTALGVGDIVTDQLITVSPSEDDCIYLEKHFATALQNGIIKVRLTFNVTTGDIFMPGDIGGKIGGNVILPMFIHGEPSPCDMWGMIYDNIIALSYSHGYLRVIARRLTFA